jgi:hypothetical protein
LQQYSIELTQVQRIARTGMVQFRNVDYSMPSGGPVTKPHSRHIRTISPLLRFNMRKKPVEFLQKGRCTLTFRHIDVY